MIYLVKNVMESFPNQTVLDMTKTLRFLSAERDNDIEAVGIAVNELLQHLKHADPDVLVSDDFSSSEINWTYSSDTPQDKIGFTVGDRLKGIKFGPNLYSIWKKTVGSKEDVFDKIMFIPESSTELKMDPELGVDEFKELFPEVEHKCSVGRNRKSFAILLKEVWNTVVEPMYNTVGVEVLIPAAKVLGDTAVRIELELEFDLETVLCDISVGGTVIPSITYNNPPDIFLRNPRMMCSAFHKLTVESCQQFREVVVSPLVTIIRDDKGSAVYGVISIPVNDDGMIRSRFLSDAHCWTHRMLEPSRNLYTIIEQLREELPRLYPVDDEFYGVHRRADRRPMQHDSLGLQFQDTERRIRALMKRMTEVEERLNFHLR